MTIKLLFEASAIELSKIQAPTLKLYEFNHYANQAVHLFINKVYNIYDINQQTTDDLRVLKATATLKPTLAVTTGNKAIDYLRGATYYVDMPDDYLHLLNCVCVYNVNKQKDCWNKGNVMVVGATKLTADNWSSIVDDVYNRPTKKRPYYYIHNQNDIYVNGSYELTNRNSQLPTNIGNTTATVASGNATDKLYDALDPIWVSILSTAHAASEAPDATATSVKTAAESVAGITADMSNAISSINTTSTASDFYLELSKYRFYASNVENFDRTFDFDNEGTIEEYSTIEKPAGSRYANSSRVKIEIRCGRDKSNIFELAAVQIDYIKSPQHLRLTQEQLDSDEDISQVLEFPDYVNQEILNELVHLVMVRTNDPKISNHILMTLTIARPTGQLQQPAAQG